VIASLIDVVLHLDVHLNEWAAYWGLWGYFFLFLIVFCETGLVVTPFLPGDSLLFALGALTATEDSVLSFPITVILLFFAAVLGNMTNYMIGRRVGPRIFSGRELWWLKQEHLLRTRHFYEKHGGKAIILTRFIPILRTFAPFVAGVSQMAYSKFMFYNILGGAIWVLSLEGAGYYFGNIPIVKQNFHIVVLGVIIVSVLPMVVEVVRHWPIRRIFSAVSSRAKRT
jgi:membrane-associated protein